jgi:CBS-domain-containing membrane protein
MHDGSKMTEVVHRIAVFDNEGRITNIVSQTDIVR